MAYLGAKLKIGCDDSHLADRNDENSANHTQEAEDVVVAALVLPHTFEHEHQLNEEDRKWNQSSQKNDLRAPNMPRLNRNLPRDRVGFGWMLPCLSLDVSVPATKVDQG